MASHPHSEASFTPSESPSTSSEAPSTPIKSALRTHFIQARKQLSTHAAEEASLAMAAHLADWINRQAIRRLGLFYPSQILQEISPLSLLHQLTLKPTYYLPRMEASRQLSFHEWSGHPSDLELSRHHLYQPTAKTPTTPPHTLDILLVPLVAFDRHGYRIGMGGGFYDKTLQHTHPRPRLIGCGYAFQEIDLFPHDPWDIPCDLIFTEHGCFTPA